MREVCQIGAEAEVDGGEDGENGDNEFRGQHALPGAHALLAKGGVGRAVLGPVRLGIGIVAGLGAGSTATAGRHGRLVLVVVGFG